MVEQQNSKMASTNNIESSSTTTKTTTIRNMRGPVDRDGKKLPQVSTTEFLIVLLVALPIWAFVLVPMAFFYQVVWKIVVCKLLLPKKIKVTTTTTSSSPKSGVIPTPDTVVPSDQRPYDVVVLGATGFTGTLAVRYLLRQYGSHGAAATPSKIRFAMAGRSLPKLQALQAQLEKEFKSSLQSDAATTTPVIEILVVDTLTPAHVISLVQQTKAIVNFVGPFQLHGGRIVMEACARYGTHYADITGELDWVKEMLLWCPNNDGVTLDDIARQTGAKLINCCGNDCVPWDLTVFKLYELLKQQDPTEDLVHVHCWDEIASTPSGGTLATVILSIQSKDPTQPKPALDPFLKLPNRTVSTARLVEDAQWWIGTTLPSPETSISLSPSYPVTAPFALAPFNAMLLTRTMALLVGENKKETILRYREVAVFPDFKSAFLVCFVLVLSLTIILLSELAPVAFLLQKVLLKSGEGPSVEAQEKHFLFLVARGTGSKGTVVEASIYFSKDPGYMDTARMAVESALSMVIPESVAKLPSKNTGGFWTPSTGLGNVLLERLVDTGTVFDSQVIRRGSN